MSAYTTRHTVIAGTLACALALAEAAAVHAASIARYAGVDLTAIPYKPAPFPNTLVYRDGKKVPLAQWYKALLARGHIRYGDGVLAPKRYVKVCKEVGYGNLLAESQRHVGRHVRVDGRISGIVPGGLLFATRKDAADQWIDPVGITLPELRLGEKLKTGIRGTMYGQYIGLVGGLPVILAKHFDFEKPKVKLKIEYRIDPPCQAILPESFSVIGTVRNAGNRDVRNLVLEAVVASRGELLAVDWLYIGDVNRGETRGFTFYLSVPDPRIGARLHVRPVSGEYAD